MDFMTAHATIWPRGVRHPWFCKPDTGQVTSSTYTIYSTNTGRYDSLLFHCDFHLSSHYAKFLANKVVDNSLDKPGSNSGIVDFARLPDR
jgi:hypothetical protein